MYGEQSTHAMEEARVGPFFADAGAPVSKRRMFLLKA
jgi:hypothetical protein